MPKNTYTSLQLRVHEANLGIGLRKDIIYETFRFYDPCGRINISRSFRRLSEAQAWFDGYKAALGADRTDQTQGDPHE